MNLRPSPESIWQCEVRMQGTQNAETDRSTRAREGWLDLEKIASVEVTSTPSSSRVTTLDLTIDPDRQHRTARACLLSSRLA